MLRLGNGQISGVAKHTPNRKCIRQTVEGERIRYLHVTKGWRSRRDGLSTGLVPSLQLIQGIINYNAKEHLTAAKRQA